MSKVIIFSRVFPAYHPRKGEETHFPEKVMAGLADYLPDYKIPDEMVLWDWYEYYNAIPKWHTIRAGNRFKVGDKFSPRIWSDKPYRSKQITIAPDIEIKKTYNFVCEGELFYLEGHQVDVTSSDIPENDGLSSDDFLNWFPVNKYFSGQIICWSSKINY